MFIMYPNDDGDNVTVSPRLGNNRAEPTFAPSIDLKVLPGTTISNESMFVLKAVCSNCRKWVDSKSTSQPMFYAFGHGYPLYSDSKSADLKRHIRYGHFTMDMVAATGTGGAPASSTAVRGVTLDGKMVRDHDRANLAHAIIGCLALFVIWPLNVIIAGFFKNIKIHVGFSVAIMAFLIVSYALGISTSAQFNRVRTIPSSTPHHTNCTTVKRLQDTSPNLRLHCARSDPVHERSPYPLNLQTSLPSTPPTHTTRLNSLPPPSPHRRPRPTPLLPSAPRHSWLHGRRTHGLPLHHRAYIMYPAPWLCICACEQSKENGRRRRPGHNDAQAEREQTQ